MSARINRLMRRGLRCATGVIKDSYRQDRARSGKASDEGRFASGRQWVIKWIGRRLPEARVAGAKTPRSTSSTGRWRTSSSCGTSSRLGQPLLSRQAAENTHWNAKTTRRGTGAACRAAVVDLVSDFNRRSHGRERASALGCRNLCVCVSLLTLKLREICSESRRLRMSLVQFLSFVWPL